MTDFITTLLSQSHSIPVLVVVTTLVAFAVLRIIFRGEVLPEQNSDPQDDHASAPVEDDHNVLLSKVYEKKQIPRGRQLNTTTQSPHTNPMHDSIPFKTTQSPFQQFNLTKYTPQKVARCDILRDEITLDDINIATPTTPEQEQLSRTSPSSVAEIEACQTPLSDDGKGNSSCSLSPMSPCNQGIISPPTFARRRE